MNAITDAGRTSASPYAATTPRRGGRPLIEACSWCRRVHEVTGAWTGRDADVTDADVTHGICPDCIDKHFPELNAAA